VSAAGEPEHAEKDNLPARPGARWEIDAMTRCAWCDKPITASTSSYDVGGCVACGQCASNIEKTLRDCGKDDNYIALALKPPRKIP